MRNRSGIPGILAAAAVLITACEVRQPVEVQDQAPLLSNLAAPDTVYLGSQLHFTLSVEAEDKQGYGDIAGVFYRFSANSSGNPFLEGAFADSGGLDDAIARDGIFTRAFILNASGIGEQGLLRVAVWAEDGDGFAGDTLYDSVYFSALSQNAPPELLDPDLPLTADRETLQNLILRIKVRDAQGHADIDSVAVEFFAPLQPVPFHRALLSDNGTGCDPAAGDGDFVFCSDMSSLIRRRGDYTLRFQAWDKRGQASRPVTAVLRVRIENLPPVLSELSAPAEVNRRTGNPIILSIRASDPDGQDDIQKVFFNTTKPDGSPSSGNPFLMYDDGASSHGDAAAGDGVYSLTITINTSNATGDYTFEFTAEDYSGLRSAPVLHVIQVVDSSVQ
ncbi:hypothetical protein JW906_12570 [bacterium]|nr:hypothetical protein [bacterium]